MAGPGVPTSGRPFVAETHTLVFRSRLGYNMNGLDEMSVLWTRFANTVIRRTRNRGPW